MTRKTALKRAVAALLAQEDCETAEVLTRLIDDLPLTHWSIPTIEDRLEQFIEDTGRPPKISDFGKHGIPTKASIKKYYGLSVKEFLLQKNYRVEKSRKQVKEEYTNIFISEFNRIKPKSGKEYDAKRTKGTPSYQTIAKYYDVNSYRKLVWAVGLVPLFTLEKDRTMSKFQMHLTILTENKIMLTYFQSDRYKSVARNDVSVIIPDSFSQSK